MAKISNGPLVASVSGKLGPVVFHQTRFGTVVQSVPKTVVHKTSAALLTKSQFALAQAALKALVPLWQIWIPHYIHDKPTTIAGQWTSAYLKALRTGSANLTPPSEDSYVYVPGTPYATATQWRLPVNTFYKSELVNPQVYGSAIQLADPLNHRPGAISISQELRFLKTRVTPPFMVILGYLWPYPLDPTPWLTSPYPQHTVLFYYP